MNLYDTATLLQAVEAMDRPQAFLRDTFFGNQVFSETETINIDAFVLDRSIAEFVSFRIDAPYRLPVASVSTAFKPPPIVERTPLDPATATSRRPGESFGGDMSADDRLQLQVLDELQRQDYRIARREEWMCAQALIAGSVTATGEGVSATINYARNAALAPAALSSTARWGESAADVIGNLETWAGLIAVHSGSIAADVIMGTGAASRFVRDPRVAAALDNRRQENGVMQLGPQAAGGQNREVAYIGQIGDFRFWRHAGIYRNAAGNDLPYIPAQGLVMVGDIAGTMGYAACPVASQQGAGVPRIGMLSAARVPDVSVVTMPPTTQVVTRSAGVPIPGRPNASLYTVVWA